ncbi:MAG TPA: hypothetical protein VGW33_00505 [Terriglobia bacterium]|nr:hypothetical protein [Terriglobia bacterium]
MPVEPDERLEILVLLADDAEEEIRRLARATLQTSVEGASDATATGEAGGAERETLLQRIGRMSAGEKIRTALLGNQEERLVLIRDSNKTVARAVLQSPKLSEMEVEAFASMKTIAEEALRVIAMNRAFTRHYPLVYALANNPRAPIDVTLPLLNRLNDRDLKALAVNKNVADALRTAAARRVREKKQ